MYYVGVDALKILSMLFITIHHILGHGGGLQSASGINYYLLWIVEIISYCGVNCYAIISGFLGYGKKHSLSKYIKLWMQVLVYSVVMAVIFYFLKKATLSDLVKSFAPVTFDQYWYFSAYTVLFFLMPLLDKFVDSISENGYKRIIVGLFVFTCYVVIGKRYSDPFRLNNGYSFVWLSILYCVGAFVKKFELQNKILCNKLIFNIVILELITIFVKLFIGPFLGHGLDDLFLSYISPTMLGISLSLILLFLKINITSHVFGWIGSSVFGVYLFHDNELFRNVVINNRFVFISKYSSIKCILLIFGFSMLIFTTGILLNKLVIKVLNSLSINTLSLNIETMVNKVFESILGKL